MRGYLPKIMDLNKIYQGNCIEVLKSFPDNSIDSIVTDPPYELGFMGKAWDNTGIANNKEMWSECLRVLKPGGHLLSFGGTRTYHRMAVAIEDAGFEVKNMIAWCYGQGFPKSLRVGCNCDRRTQTIRREICKKCGGVIGMEGYGTALKPAIEPICMAMKPISEKTIRLNVLKWGTGGINIDKSRVDFVSEEDRKESTTKNQHADFGTKPMTNNNVYGDYSMMQPKNFNPTGRFPANLIHDNSDEVRECFPETKQGSDKPRNRKTLGSFGMPNDTTPEYADSGNASRFFKSIIYQSKASKKDRGEGNIHPTVKNTALMEYLIKMVTPKGGIVLDPFAGSGSTLVAAKKNGFQYVGIELDEEYCKIAESRLKVESLNQEILF